MGNRAGIPNRNKTFLLKRLQDMYGDDFHPIMRMAENAVVLHEIANTAEPENASFALKSSIDAWDKIAQYTEPKLKAIELTGEDGGPLQVAKVNRKIVDTNDTDS